MLYEPMRADSGLDMHEHWDMVDLIGYLSDVIAFWDSTVPPTVVGHRARVPRSKCASREGRGFCVFDTRAYIPWYLWDSVLEYNCS